MEKFADQFLWRVRQGGYYVRSVEKRGVTGATEITGAQTEDDKRYNPFESYPALFIYFCLTTPDAPSSRAFADRFGLLFGGGVDKLPLDDVKLAAAYPSSLGEPVSAWTMEIRRMAKIVCLWLLLRISEDDTSSGGSCLLPREVYQRIESGDVKTWFERLIKDLLAVHKGSNSSDASWAAILDLAMRVDKKQVRKSDGPLEHVTECLATVLAILGPDFSSCSADTVALEATVGQIPVPQKQPWPEPSIRGAVTLILQYCLNRYMADLAAIELVRTDSPVSLQWRCALQTLLGAMWLQFANAVVERKNFRACKDCGKWFLAPKDMDRTGKLFCSTACRVRSHRISRETAVTLFKDGVEIAGIAEEMGTTVSQIAEWLQSEGIDPKAK